MHPGDPITDRPNATNDHTPTRPDARQRLQTLSRRELQVLELLATGASAKAIADQLGIKPTTVKQHLRNIYLKLGAGNRVQATRWYLLARPDRVAKDLPAPPSRF
jgi:DNA-binding NarL/FixJ family response regulator